MMEYIDASEGKTFQSTETNSLDDPFVNGMMLDMATREFLRSGRASIPLLQRSFSIDFNRACSLFDYLCELGIVKKSDGTVRHQLCVTAIEYELISEQVQRIERKSDFTKIDISAIKQSF